MKQLLICVIVLCAMGAVTNATSNSRICGPDEYPEFDPCIGPGTPISTATPQPTAVPTPSPTPIQTMPPTRICEPDEFPIFDGCVAGPTPLPTPNPTPTPVPTPTPDPFGNNGDPSLPVKGYAELHSHLMAEHMFGGSYFWGSASGPINEALARCSGGLTKEHAHIDSGMPGIGIRDRIVSEFLGDDTGLHLGMRRGYDNRKCKVIKTIFGDIRIPGTCPRPHFAHWPAHNAKSHQQMWHGHLKQAYDKGLQIMVVSFTESSFLCGMTSTIHRKYHCDEMDSVVRQAQRLREFVSEHSSWLGIAESPREARELIAQNKLPLVLAAEISDLFPNGDIRTQLQQFYDLGIRSIQLAHHKNNRFAGSAPIPKLLNAVDKVELLYGEKTDINEVSCWLPDGLALIPGNKKFLCNGDNRLSSYGLTSDGQELMRAMMDKGMLIDLAHLNRQSLSQSYDLIEQETNNLYPIFSSHVEMWDAVHPDMERNEKYMKPDELARVRATDGMVGIRTSPIEAQQYSETVSLDDRPGTAGDFAQWVMYAVDSGINVGFGADMNGFIEQTQDSAVRNDTEFSRKGLAHIGLLPDLVDEIDLLGTPQRYLDHLGNSAEQFIRTWERAERLKLQHPSMLEGDLRANTGEWIHYKFDVPSDSFRLMIQTFGDNGDADIYVRRGLPPTTTEFDYRPYLPSSAEAVEIDLVGGDDQPGIWYVSVRAYRSFTNLSLQVNALY